MSLFQWNPVENTYTEIGDGIPSRRPRGEPPETYVLPNLNHRGTVYPHSLAFDIDDTRQLFRNHNLIPGIPHDPNEFRDQVLSTILQGGRLATYESDKSHRFTRMVTLPDGEKKRLCVFLGVRSIEEAKVEYKKIKRLLAGGGTPYMQHLDAHDEQRKARSTNVFMLAPNGNIYETDPRDVESKTRLGFRIVEVTN